MQRFLGPFAGQTLDMTVVRYQKETSNQSLFILTTQTIPAIFALKACTHFSCSS